MVSEIKFGSIGSSFEKSEAVQKEVVAPKLKSQDVTVSNQLGKLVNSVVADETSSVEQARVMNMKARIQSNDYTVDTDLLADKLYHQLFAAGISG